jgi:hypothetical protein
MECCRWTRPPSREFFGVFWGVKKRRNDPKKLGTNRVRILWVERPQFDLDRIPSAEYNQLIALNCGTAELPPFTCEIGNSGLARRLPQILPAKGVGRPLATFSARCDPRIAVFRCHV